MEIKSNKIVDFIAAAQKELYSGDSKRFRTNFNKLIELVNIKKVRIKVVANNLLMEKVMQLIIKTAAEAFQSRQPK